MLSYYVGRRRAILHLTVEAAARLCGLELSSGMRSSPAGCPKTHSISRPSPLPSRPRRRISSPSSICTASNRTASTSTHKQIGSPLKGGEQQLVKRAPEPEEPKVKRMNMNLEANLHNAFKVATAAQGTTMTDALLAFIEQYVAKHYPAGLKKGRA
jgi:hypothetical protein